MDLSKYDFPAVTKSYMAFSVLEIPKELVNEAESRNLKKGRRKFNQYFFNGCDLKVKKDVPGTWKEKALLWCFAISKSRMPKHEHKEAVCAMIFEECIVI